MILLYISKKKAAPFLLPPMAMQPLHFNPFMPKRGLECGITTSFCNTTADSVAISVRRTPPQQQQQQEEEGDVLPFHHHCSICSPQCEVKAGAAAKDEEGLISDNLLTPGGGEEKRRRIGDGAFKILQDEMWLRTQQQQQMEIQWLLSQHVMEERQRWWVRLLMEGGMVKRLVKMEEEVERVRERNCGLKEMVKCLNVEKEAWREMAIRNEAAVNMLKSSSSSSSSSSSMSSSSSSQVGWSGKRMGKKKVVVGMCRRCRWRASTVVVLPCKHLCLCHLCGSKVKRCPVCNCSRNMTVSVHVNLC